MPFADFLRTTVLLNAGAATALGAVCALGAGTHDEPNVALLALGWWILAGLAGARLGRRTEPSPAIARLLAGARAQSSLPENRPGATVINRLWPLLVATLAAVVLGLIWPQVPGIAAGFALLAALSWRRQHRAVIAIEQRDGVRFHVEQTSPVRPIELVRTPWYKAYLPQQERAA